MNIYPLTASFFGIGYIQKGGGTVAAGLTGLLVYWIFHQNEEADNWILGLFLTISLVGWISSAKVDAIWGKDSNKVVIDEVAGMIMSILFVPVTPKAFLIAFVLFRLFDIYKPLYIKKLENISGGFGVMADDWLAGVYANLITQIIFFALFKL